MSTPALLSIFDEQDNLLVNIYIHCDGHPTSFGKDLVTFLDSIKIGNGIPNESDDFANGMGDLAAQIIAHFKSNSMVGGVYIIYDGYYVNTDYQYFLILRNGVLELDVLHNDHLLYSGTIEQLMSNCQ